MFWEFHTFIIRVEIISVDARFTDFFAAFDFISVPFFGRVNPSVFITMINWFADDDFLHTFSTVDFVTFFARSTVSPLISGFAVSWQLDTFVITVQIIIAIAFNTDFFASINPAVVNSLFGINVSVFSTMIIINDWWS